MILVLLLTVALLVFLCLFSLRCSYDSCSDIENWLIHFTAHGSTFFRLNFVSFAVVKKRLLDQEQNIHIVFRLVL